MKRNIFIIQFIIFGSLISAAQPDTILLNLDKAIKIALDSSLQAFKAQNIYQASYWSYNNYKASKLPSLNLTTNPFTFNRSFVQQYNIADTGYVFIEDQSISSKANLSLEQNLTLTGGTFYINSGLSRLQNFKSTNIQFASTPFSIGYSQPILGYNEFKWQRKTEPRKYEQAKRELIQASQEISLTLIPLYFDLLKAELDSHIAKQKLANSDTLYRIGQKRYEIASIDRADLLTLKLDYINAKNELAQAKNSLERSKDALIVFLKLDDQAPIELELPNVLSDADIDPEFACKFAQEYSPFYLSLETERLIKQGYVEKTKKESLLNASFDASFGLNQQSTNLRDSYNNLSDQQIITLALQIPLVDWGVRKSVYNMAKRELDIKIIEIEQQKQDFRQDLIQTVHEFNLQNDIILSTKEAENIATESYEINKQRFILGKIDINTLSIQQTRKEEAQRNVIEELEKFWNYYYKIQSLTLYNIKIKKPLAETFEFEFIE